MEATLIIFAKFKQNRSWCRVNFPIFWAARPGMTHVTATMTREIKQIIECLFQY